MIQTSPQTILFISHHEDFLTQTADTIIHLRQIKHRKEAETIVEHLGYQDYSSQREQQFKQQSQQAANDQRTYKKTMEKHRRVRQQVETSLPKHQGIALPDDLPYAKENESPSLSTRKALTDAGIPIP